MNKLGVEHWGEAPRCDSAKQVKVAGTEIAGQPKAYGKNDEIDDREDDQRRECPAPGGGPCGWGKDNSDAEERDSDSGGQDETPQPGVDALPQRQMNQVVEANEAYGRADEGADERADNDPDKTERDEQSDSHRDVGNRS